MTRGDSIDRGRILDKPAPSSDRSISVDRVVVLENMKKEMQSMKTGIDKLVDERPNSLRELETEKNEEISKIRDETQERINKLDKDLPEMTYLEKRSDILIRERKEISRIEKAYRVNTNQIEENIRQLEKKYKDLESTYDHSYMIYQSERTKTPSDSGRNDILRRGR